MTYNGFTQIYDSQKLKSALKKLLNNEFFGLSDSQIWAHLSYLLEKWKFISKIDVESVNSSEYANQVEVYFLKQPGGDIFSTDDEQDRISDEAMFNIIQEFNERLFKD